MVLYIRRLHHQHSWGLMALIKKQLSMDSAVNSLIIYIAEQEPIDLAIIF